MSTIDVRDHFANFEIKHFGRFLAKRFGPGILCALATTITDWPNDAVHPIVCTGLESHTSDLLEIILGTGGDVLSAEENFLRDTSAQCHAYSVQHLGCGK